MEILRETSNLASVQMASKRRLPSDQMYPPKKRALFEHKLLHGIENFALNEQKSAPDASSKHEINEKSVDKCMTDYKDNKENVYFKMMHNYQGSATFPRQRSDSLQSVHSQISESGESTVTISRESSPVEICGTVFDHRTPERTPSSGYAFLRPQVSKPLFPDADERGGLNVRDSDFVNQQKFSFAAETTSVRMNTTHEPVRERSLEDNERNGSNNKDNVNENTYGNSRDNVAETSHEFNKSANLKSEEESKNKTYMGPMVSLLEKFNSVAPNTSTSLSLQIKNSTNNIKVLDVCLSNKHEMRNGESPNSLASATDSQDEISGAFKCGECPQSFSSLDALRNHVLVHEEKSMSCWVCNMEFSGSEKLVSHMKLFHKGVNPYRCQHCSREFSQYNNLRRHLRVHREKLYKCKVCDREFNEEFYLKMHMSTHTGKRVYSCGVCNAGFPSSNELKIHVKSHSPSQLHTCDVCGKSFSKACVLRQHKKGHTGDRPHKCDIA